MYKLLHDGADSTNKKLLPCDALLELMQTLGGHFVTLFARNASLRSGCQARFIRQIGSDPVHILGAKLVQFVQEAKNHQSTSQCIDASRDASRMVVEGSYGARLEFGVAGPANLAQPVHQILAALQT